MPPSLPNSIAWPIHKWSGWALRKLAVSALLAGAFASLSQADLAESSPPVSSPYAKWPHGPPADPAFFPLAVWLQDPANAQAFKNAGFNTYVGLWEGPTEEQLAGLKQAGMRVICEQNAVALRHLEDPAIVGWMHGDEPDNAQSLGAGLGWGTPVAPAKIVADYQRIRKADPSRPVMLNLGQGVAWDDWYGRGPRSRHPEDYPKYLEGCDIASFDIYPVVHERPEVAGKLWYVGHGVERLVQWGDGNKVAWNCLECTRISNPNRKPTPHQVRCEAWMSLIHGSQGLILFVHQFKPKFREAALLDDPEMLAAVTALNRQITELAPVLNSPKLEKSEIGSSSGDVVASSETSVPVAVMLKRYQGALYVFAVAMREGTTTATFTVKGLMAPADIEVLGENRTVRAREGLFEDRFGPWDVHLYRVRL